MAFEARRRATAVVVVAVAAWFFMWFRRRVEDSRSVTYGPLAERDKQRMNNLSVRDLRDTAQGRKKI